MIADMAGKTRSGIAWKAFILLGWPILIALDWFTTGMLLAAGGTELNPIVYFVLQFGPSHFLALKIFQALLFIVTGLSLNYILRRVTWAIGFAPHARTILIFWTFGLSAPVVWNIYFILDFLLAVQRGTIMLE